MLYSLLVLATPWSGHSNRHAVLFAEGALARGHRIRRVFFLDDGVSTGNSNVIYPQDEDSPVDIWLTLAQDHNVELVLCVSSALKRGLLNETEAARRERTVATTLPCFTVSGLGQLLEAGQESDRLVTFGG
ncbi:MAG: sulfurtransferase complex subunit TusD [Pseudomonadota bacterium]